MCGCAEVYSAILCCTVVWLQSCAVLYIAVVPETVSPGGGEEGVSAALHTAGRWLRGDVERALRPARALARARKVYRHYIDYHPISANHGCE